MDNNRLYGRQDSRSPLHPQGAQLPQGAQPAPGVPVRQAPQGQQPQGAQAAPGANPRQVPPHNVKARQVINGLWQGVNLAVANGLSWSMREGLANVLADRMCATAEFYGYDSSDPLMRENLHIVVNSLIKGGAFVVAVQTTTPLLGYLNFISSFVGNSIQHGVNMAKGWNYLDAPANPGYRRVSDAHVTVANFAQQGTRGYLLALDGQPGGTAHSTWYRGDTGSDLATVVASCYTGIIFGFLGGICSAGYIAMRDRDAGGLQLPEGKLFTDAEGSTFPDSTFDSRVVQKTAKEFPGRILAAWDHEMTTDPIIGRLPVLGVQFVHVALMDVLKAIDLPVHVIAGVNAIFYAYVSAIRAWGRAEPRRLDELKLEKYDDWVHASGPPGSVARADALAEHHKAVEWLTRAMEREPTHWETFKQYGIPLISAFATQTLVDAVLFPDEMSRHLNQESAEVFTGVTLSVLTGVATFGLLHKLTPEPFPLPEPADSKGETLPTPGSFQRATALGTGVAIATSTVMAATRGGVAGMITNGLFAMVTSGVTRTLNTNTKSAPLPIMPEEEPRYPSKFRIGNSVRRAGETLGAINQAIHGTPYMDGRVAVEQRALRRQAQLDQQAALRAARQSPVRPNNVRMVDGSILRMTTSTLVGASGSTVQLTDDEASLLNLLHRSGRPGGSPRLDLDEGELEMVASLNDLFQAENIPMQVQVKDGVGFLIHQVPAQPGRGNSSLESLENKNGSQAIEPEDEPEDVLGHQRRFLGGTVVLNTFLKKLTSGNLTVPLSEEQVKALKEINDEGGDIVKPDSLIELETLARTLEMAAFSMEIIMLGDDIVRLQPRPQQIPEPMLQSPVSIHTPPEIVIDIRDTPPESKG
jgi:hypothetical protein